MGGVTDVLVRLVATLVHTVTEQTAVGQTPMIARNHKYEAINHRITDMKQEITLILNITDKSEYSPL